MASAYIKPALDLLRLGRPLFLVGGFTMYALGAAAALYAGAALDTGVLIWGQLAVSATQLMVHYANDYFDLPADIANRTPTPWSGGSRVLPAGQLHPRVALFVALCLLSLALMAALVLAFVLRTGPWTLPLIGAGVLLSWTYSAPPVRWNWRGCGEIITMLVVPGLTPLLGFYLQAGHIEGWLLTLQAPLVCLQVAMQLSVNFPDAEADARVGKQTLVTRLGPRSARLYAVLVVLAYALLPLQIIAGLPPLVPIAASLLLPLALWQARRVLRGAWAEPRAWNSVAFASIVLLIGTAWLQAAALVLMEIGS